MGLLLIEKTVLFLVLLLDIIRNSIQLNLYAIPTSAQALNMGYSLPQNANWIFPVVATTPQLNVISQSFGNLIGLNFGLYPVTTQGTTQSFLSTTTPIISPVNSYVMTCNLLNSKYSIPNTTFFSLPLSGSLGTLITSNVSTVVFNTINPQSYNEIVITFFDQYFNPLILHDFDCTITLAIKEPDAK